MEKFIIQGGSSLHGSITVSGAKNVALKALVAACLTDEEVVIHNIPLISDFFVMVEIIKELGGKVLLEGHSIRAQLKDFKSSEISLDKAARIRTSSMFIAPLLIRCGSAKIPNPGGCRLGARPIDRTIEGLKHMGAIIDYDSKDGFFHAKLDSSQKGLHGTEYTFEKNTHTGTETLIIASVLATGKTVLHNAAEEPEIDDLINLLNKMGAQIKRTQKRVIEIIGVEKLHGTTFTVSPDRNEIITFAIAAIMTEGDIYIDGVRRNQIDEFIEKFEETGAGFEEKESGVRFFYKGELNSTHIITKPYPGFMTDWQSPWALMMTKAKGTSTIHETVFENRFSYVAELKKMGAHIKLYNPKVQDMKNFYNFNMDDDDPEFFHAAEIQGPTSLHNAIVTISDLRAGATLVLAAISVKGESIVYGVKKLDRGYENFDKRLNSLGAHIVRTREE